MRKTLAASAFAIVSMFLISVSAAAADSNPTVILSGDEVSFFNGDSDSVDATMTNNDNMAHTFTVSIFPNTFDAVSADTSLNHVTLAPHESTSAKVLFSSLFDAQFIPRQFTLTVAAIDDPSISASKNVVVTILRRSPVFVLALVTDKFNYQPGETINVSSVVANLGGDTNDQFSLQASISKDGQFVKRFQSDITFLPQKSQNTFSNLYTIDQFAAPGIYSAQITLKDGAGQTLSIKSLNFNVLPIQRASQQESSSVGVFDVTNTIVAKNEGNSPSDLKVTATIPSIAGSIFDSDLKPSSMETVGGDLHVSWVFSGVPAGETAQVVYKLSVWKIWVGIIAVIVVVFLAFKFVFTVKIFKRARFFGPMTKDAEVPVNIEVVNRSVSEVKDIVVRDFIPPIARVVPKFETVKPTIRETASGTEITWKFDSLRAGEERIMSYRIKPKMDVLGTLKLNPATVYYAKRNRQKKSAASSVVIVRE